MKKPRNTTPKVTGHLFSYRPSMTAKRLPALVTAIREDGLPLPLADIAKAVGRIMGKGYGGIGDQERVEALSVEVLPELDEFVAQCFVARVHGQAGREQWVIEQFWPAYSIAERDWIAMKLALCLTERALANLPAVKDA